MMIVPENAPKAVALWEALGLGRNPRRSGLLEHRPLKPVDLAKVPPAIGAEIHRTSRRARRQQERLRKDGMRREQLMRWCRREGLGSAFRRTWSEPGTPAVHGKYDSARCADSEWRLEPGWAA